MMKTKEEIANKLKELKPYLEHKFHVEKIGFFGSYARGEQTMESDIDILVSFNKTPGWEFFDLQDFLNEQLNISVDLLSEKAIKRQLRQIILSDVIYV